MYKNISLLDFLYIEILIEKGVCFYIYKVITFCISLFLYIFNVTELIIYIYIWLLKYMFLYMIVYLWKSM